MAALWRDFGAGLDFMVASTALDRRRCLEFLGARACRLSNRLAWEGVEQSFWVATKTHPFESQDWAHTRPAIFSSVLSDLCVVVRSRGRFIFLICLFSSETSFLPSRPTFTLPHAPALFLRPCSVQAGADGIRPRGAAAADAPHDEAQRQPPLFVEEVRGLPARG